MREERALIWPATPTDTLTVRPISIRRNPVISPDGCVANLADTSEGNVSLPWREAIDFDEIMVPSLLLIITFH